LIKLYGHFALKEGEPFLHVHAVLGLPDGSARTIRGGLAERLGVDVAVLITDTAGRPWRVGLTDIAIGAAGIAGFATS